MVHESTHLRTRNPRTVLLMGNSRGVLKQISFALQTRGHSVIWGDSAQAGLRIAESENPDLIISETCLPDGSGIEICQKIKASFYSETPFVLVGRLGCENEEQRQAYRAGADDYFAAFADRLLLMAKLEWLMARSSTPVRGCEAGMTETMEDARTVTDVLDKSEVVFG